MTLKKPRSSAFIFVCSAFCVICIYFSFLYASAETLAKPNSNIEPSLSAASASSSSNKSASTTSARTKPSAKSKLKPSSAPAKKEEKPAPEKEQTIEQTLIAGNREIAQWFDGFAESVDLFIVGKRVTKRKNESSFRIENSTFSQEGIRPSNSTALNVNIRLPNLEDYWQFKFTTYDEREENRGAAKSVLRQTPKEQNVGASLGVIQTLGKVRSAFRPRIELQNPLKISHTLSFESILEYPEVTVNPKLEFFASPTKGVGTFLAFNFHRPLNTVYAVNLINEGEYLEKTHLFSETNGISLEQQLSDSMGFSYGLMFVSTNQPHFHLDKYTFSIGWNHVLYRRILDYQVIPYLEFNRLKDFWPFAGIVVNLNLTF